MSPPFEVLHQELRKQDKHCILICSDALQPILVIAIVKIFDRSNNLPSAWEISWECKNVYNKNKKQLWKSWERLFSVLIPIFCI